MKRVLVDLCAGTLALAFAAGSQPAAAADAVRPVGSIDLGTCQVLASGVDSSLHLLIVEQQVLQGSCGAPSGANFVLSVFSTSSLRRVAVAPIQVLGGIERMQVDEAHHRVFVLDSSASPAGGDAVLVYTISRLKSSSTPVPPDSTISVPSTAIGAAGAGAIAPGNLTGPAADYALRFTGSAYDAKTNQLYATLDQNFGGVNAVTSQNGPGADDVYLADVDLGSAGVRWAEVLDSCVYDTSTTSLYHLNVGAPILFRHTSTGTELDAGCMYSRSPALVPTGQTLGLGGDSALISGSMMTYRIPLDATGTPISGASTYSIGRTHAYGGVADPADGRIFWAAAPVSNSSTVSVSDSGANAVVYDAAEGVYDGAVTISSAANAGTGFQLATANHRLYSVGPDGILVDGASATPPGQGVWFAGYSCATANLDSDAGLRRLIAFPYSDCRNPHTAPATKALVFEDDYQLAPPPTPPDPDSYTTQVAEKDGVTGSQYTGHAEATGTRVRLIGGIHGAVSGATFGLNDYALGFAPGTDPVPADYATHEIDLAAASGADLGNYQASAGSIAAYADGATREQMKAEDGADWPFQSTACSDPGTRQASQQYASDTASSAQCQFGSEAQTTSAASPTSVTLYVAGLGQTSQQVAMPVDLGANLSSATVQLTSDKGLVSTASSEVKDVTIALPSAGELRIDSVTLTMSCRAHGRTSTATCSLSRVVNGVTYAGQAVGSGSCTEAPGVDTCGQLLAALNKIRPGILVFEIPNPDLRAGYFHGSPGGYQALGQREYYEHLQDQVLNYDGSEQLPGLQIVYVNDSISSPSRLDLQLGDVEAEAHYGITLLPPPCTACDGGAPLAPVLGAPPAPVHVTPPAAPSAATVISRILQRIWNGIRVLLRSPAAAAAAIALLLMLISPLLMGMRRRRLELLLQEVSS